MISFRCITLAILAPVASFNPLVRCGSWAPPPEDRREIYTLNLLVELGIFIETNPDILDVDPQSDIRAIFERLHNLELMEEISNEYVDSDQTTLIDAWGQPLQIIRSNGDVIGIGSAGANKIWEDGHSDDLIRIYQVGTDGDAHDENDLRGD